MGVQIAKNREPTLAGDVLPGVFEGANRSEPNALNSDGQPGPGPPGPG